MKDFNYAVRMLLKSPAFSIIAIVTLALGIGANSAIFSVVNTVLLKPLPFKNPDQLVMIWGTFPQEPNSQQTDSFPDFYDYRAQSESFSAMAGYTGAGTVLTGIGEAQELAGVAVAGDFFEVLGVTPMLGRGFTAAESKLGGPNVVVISHGLWQRGFASNPKVIGEQVKMAGKSYTLLGVMPPGVKFPVDEEKSDFIAPLEPFAATMVPQRSSHFLKLIGRLKPGLSAKQAQAEMKPIAARLAQQYPETNANRDVALVPLLENVVGDVRPALLILLGAVALVLLIACANVANLLLARAAARGREIGIRVALGASRGRIVRQLLAESFLLAILGGAGGLLLAWWGVDLLRIAGPANVPRLNEVRVDGLVCAFAFGLAILSTIIFGLAPALQISRPDLNASLQQGAKGSTGGLQGTRVRAFLVISQVALSLLLLAGAGLLIKSFFNLRATNLGFDPSRLLVLDQSISRTKYPDENEQRQFYNQLLVRLATLPGVEAVGAANPLPFSGNDNASSFAIAGQPSLGPGNNSDASHLAVTPGYFRAMKIPLRAGRDFNARDNENAVQVVMVNEAFVRRFLPRVNPLGQHVLLDREDAPPVPLEIVGVVGDTKQIEIGAPITPEMYQPAAQMPSRRLWFVFRTATTNLAGMHAAVRNAVHAQDPDVFVGDVEPITNFIGKQLAQPRFNMLLFGMFAGVAIVLAGIGIYGVIAYSVTQRTREIGIRMALGAQRRDMLRMILRQSLTLVGVGLTIGLIAAFLGTRLLKTLLYEVSANDFTIYATVVFLLSAAALLASYIPARRAMRVNPIVALRAE